MKKLLIILSILLATSCYAGQVSDQLAGIVANRDQASDVVDARAYLQEATMAVDQAWQQVQDIKASGSFNTVPTELKQTLNDWHGILQTLRQSIAADADIMECYEWTP